MTLPKQLLQRKVREPMNIVSYLFQIPIPSPFVQEKGEIHLWWIWLDKLAPEREWLFNQLSINEQLRGLRFHTQGQRDCFIAAHGATRIILSQYLSMNPADIEIDQNEHGKPFLRCKRDCGVYFNLSHSSNLALFAVTRDREIGVDVERVRPENDLEDVARRFFSSREVRTLFSPTRPMRQKEFYQYWTAKEAFIKAHGKGLSIPLDAFDVALERDRTSDREDYLQGKTPWRLKTLHAPAGYVASMVVTDDAQCY